MSSSLFLTTAEAGKEEISFAARHLPVLASTQFCMEILLRGPILDLASTLEVLRFDPCAILRLFAEAGEALSGTEDLPPSLSSCIVALGVAGLHRALACSPSTWQQQGSLAAWAQHAVTVAQSSAALAERLNLSPEMAYVVGLLHDIGGLPVFVDSLFSPHPSPEPHVAIVAVAKACHLPGELSDALMSLNTTTDPLQVWPGLIRAAHEIAELDQPFVRTEPPLLEQHS